VYYTNASLVYYYYEISSCELLLNKEDIQKSDIGMRDEYWVNIDYIFDD
jgi:hypothetical protein